jgi:hypothetical protein
MVYRAVREARLVSEQARTSALTTKVYICSDCDTATHGKTTTTMFKPGYMATAEDSSGSPTGDCQLRCLSRTRMNSPCNQSRHGLRPRSLETWAEPAGDVASFQ